MPQPWDKHLEAQAGRLSRPQLLGFGISERTIHRKCAADEWSRPLPGVVLLDDRDPARGRIWECALYAGPDAVIDWPLAGRLLKWDAMPPPIDDVTLAITEQRRVRAQPGLQIRRIRGLAAHAVRLPGYPPLLAMPEVLLCAANEVSFVRLRAIVDSAFFRKDVTSEELKRILGTGGRGRMGTTTLAAASDTWSDEFEAIAESRFAGLMADAGVDLEPQAAVPWPDGTEFHTDFRERGTQNYFEVDSQAHHSSRSKRREDARRDKRIRQLGGDVERIEGTDVMYSSRRAVQQALAFLRDRRAA
jgi:hypothetical protein